MTNHPNRRKLTIADLKNETLLAKDCRRRMKMGGLEDCGSDWQAGWYLSKDNQIKVGLTYRGSVCALSSVGHSAPAHGFVELLDSDWESILGRRDGSPEELRDRKQRERRECHETLLWRLEKAQDAVNDAVLRQDDVDLVAVAQEAFTGYPD